MACSSRTVLSSGVASSAASSPPTISTATTSSRTRRCVRVKPIKPNLLAIERYHPSLILWGSTDERSSIVVSTAHGTKTLASGSPEWESVMLQRMNTRVKKFLATGARVILQLEPPGVHPNVHTSDADDEDYARMNALLKKVAAKHPHQVAVVDLAPRVCPLGSALSSRRAGLQPETDVRHADRPTGRDPLSAERIALGGAVAGARRSRRRQKVSHEGRSPTWVTRAAGRARSRPMVVDGQVASAPPTLGRPQNGSNVVENVTGRPGGRSPGFA